MHYQQCLAEKYSCRHKNRYLFQGITCFQAYRITLHIQIYLRMLPHQSANIGEKLFLCLLFQELNHLVGHTKLKRNSIESLCRNLVCTLICLSRRLSIDQDTGKLFILHQRGEAEGWCSRPRKWQKQEENNWQYRRWKHNWQPPQMIAIGNLLEDGDRGRFSKGLIC